MVDVHAVIISQFRAALAMLDAAIDACPDGVWDDARCENRFWHVAYHALHYTHLYLSPSEEAFVPWAKDRKDAWFLGPYPWPPHDVPEVGDPYTKAELREHASLVTSCVTPGVTSPALEAPSGFSWIPLTRLELHLYNIRHAQHHAGQLVDRVRRDGGKGVVWVGRGVDA